MAETPLQKLMRLKKEKLQLPQVEQVKQDEQQQPSSTLEAVQETTGNSEVGTVAQGGVHHEPVERDKQPSPESVPVEVSVSSVVVDSVSSSVAETKPLSAMDRLRALKSGVKQDDSTRSVSPVSPAPDIAEPAKVIKERKTHPIAMEMAELEEALDAQVPGFVSILSTIHKKLKADPNVVTLLDDDEIAVIVAGLEKHTNVTIVAPSAVKAAKAKAKKEPVSAGDL